MGGERGFTVFLSYAREDDEPFVKRLYRDLVQRSVSVWWDRKAMQSRGNSFLQEIRDAIADLERVILVVGPRAVESDYVRVEWQFALEMCKVVVPILRSGPEHAVPRELRHDDFTLVPEQLRRFHVPDFRDDGHYAQALDELVRIMSAPPAPLASLADIDPLPPHFQARSGPMARLRDAVLADIAKPTVITSQQRTIALQGMGGVGKSVIAAAFARSCETRRAFGDGMFWLRFGRTDLPTADAVLTNLRRIASAFGDGITASSDTVEDLATQVQRLLSDRRCLLILDDVWSVEVAQTFVGVAGARCRVVTTTRDASIAVDLGAAECPIDVLDNDDALALLAEWTGTAGTLPDVGQALVLECGRLPLAVAMVGAMVRGKPANRWQDTLKRLRDADLEKIRRQFPNYPYPNLLRVIDVSVSALGTEQSERYLDLAVFHADVAIPELALEVFWSAEGIGPADVHDLVDLFVDRSLARRVSPGRIVLHDLQRDYVVHRRGDTESLHQRMVDAYRRQSPQGWAFGPNDGYYFQHLCWHLHEAGRRTELLELLLDPEWLEARLRATDANEAARDCALESGSTAVSLLARALGLSAHALSGRTEEIRGQLLGRLAEDDDPAVAAFCARLADAPSSRPWLRPVRPTLSRSGGPLLRTIRANEFGIRAALVTPDFSLAVSSALEIGEQGERSSPLRLWDLGTGTEVRAFHGHRDEVLDVALDSEGRTLISVSRDNTLRRWNLATGEELGRLDFPKSIQFVRALPGGARVLCVGSDELQLWDLDTKTLVSRYVVQTTRIGACAVTRDGKHAAVKGWKGSIQLIAIESWNVVWELAGFAPYESPVTFDAAGQTLFAPTADRRISVVAVQTGERILYVTHRHEMPATSLAVTPDSSRILAGLNDGALLLLDRIGQHESILLHEHENRITHTCMSRDGARALTASTDGTLKTWDLSCMRASLATRAHSKTVMQIAACPDAREALSVSGDRTLVVWRLDSARPRVRLSTEHWIQGVAVLPDGERAVTAESDAILRLWDYRQGLEIANRRREQDGTYHSLTLTPDGRHVIVAWYIDDLQDHIYGLSVWDIDRLEKVGMSVDDAGTHTPLHGHRLAMAADPELGLTPHAEGVTLWRIVNGTPTVYGAIRTGRTADVVWIPGTRLVAAALEQGTVEIWSLESERRIRETTVSERALRCIAASGDGRMLVIAGRDGRVHVLRAPTLEVVASFSLDAGVDSCAITPDCRTVLAGDVNGGVHVFALERAGT